MSDYNTSYLFGDDTISGWGPRYFFTFYGEFGDRKGSAIAEVIVLTLTFLLSVILNATIACAVLRYREMRTVTNCFLLNLAAADLVFALGIPAVAVTRLTQQWVLTDNICRILPYSQFVCGFVLLWTLTLISMDRHRCIVVPPYRSQLTTKLAVLLTLGTWLIAAILFLPVAFWFREQHVYKGKVICTLVFPRSESVNLSLCFTVPVILFACILPMGLLVFHYQRIFHKLIKTRNRWSNNVTTAEPLPGEMRRQSSLSIIGSIVAPWPRKISCQSVFGQLRTKSPAQEEMRITKHIRVVRVLILNIIAVLVMWLPITVIMFLIYVDGSRPNSNLNFFLRSHHFLWALLVALLNTIVNPLLYGILSENFRTCFAKLWFGSYRRRRNTRFADTTKSHHGVSRQERDDTPSSGRWNDGYSASPGRPSPVISQINS